MSLPEHVVLNYIEEPVWPERHAEDALAEMRRGHDRWVVLMGVITLVAGLVVLGIAGLA